MTCLFHHNEGEPLLASSSTCSCVSLKLALPYMSNKAELRKVHLKESGSTQPK
jgi:hypothetical protein